MNILAGWIALVVFLVSLIALLVIGKRKITWYRVRLAQPEMSEEHVYRTMWDRMWLTDWAGMMIFRQETGRPVRITKHWIIKVEEEEEDKP